LLDAMMAHPILINRPIVVTPLGVKLCRPSEAVLDILPNPQRGACTKEDGEPVVGVLVEAPVMLSAVHIVMRTRIWHERGTSTT
ncbi:hypothetical protein NL364_30020, partial [Klebsiella pneumoniae]|nr:hypothetical protein [Klebsiella pneumoniae]